MQILENFSPSYSAQMRRESETKARILVVDDDRPMQMVLENKLDRMQHEVLLAANGKQAIEKLLQEKDAIDVILLDREMPIMDGMELVEKLSEHDSWKYIPVIMQTGSDKPEQVKEGLDAGVFYYLTKPYDDNILQSVVNSAIQEARQRRVLNEELSRHRASFGLIEACRFRFRTLDEAESLVVFAANCFPDPPRMINGLAELMVNAVEHGNLGISYEEKTALVESNSWREEVGLRSELPENKSKFVEMAVQAKEGGIYLRIKDMGNGFDWKKYLDLDPSRASHNHGRGIAQANMLSFDKILYNEIGNEVTGFVSTDSVHENELDW